MNWSKILNWRLLSGSHKFPGEDGGTCINEAAIVAAGFRYKSVGSIDDLPKCFCPILGGALIVLNDTIWTDELRHEMLFPFVTRLAGSAGTPRDRLERVGILRKSAQDAILWLDRYCYMSDTEYLYHNARQAWSLADANYRTMNLLTREPIVNWLSGTDFMRVNAYHYTCSMPENMRVEALQAAVDGLRRAFAVGPQAPAVEVDTLRNRFDEVRPVEPVA